MEILEWKWEYISMDFVVSFLKSVKENNANWIIIDLLTKTSRFLPVKMMFSIDQFA